MAGTSPAMTVMGVMGFPARAKEFPAYSLLGRKKFPARPRREFYRKALNSKAFSMLIFAKKAEFPADSLLRREFSLLAGPRPNLQEPPRLRQLHLGGSPTPP